MMNPKSPISSRILRLVRERDMDGLVRLLRQPADAVLRAQAAIALADLADFDAVENLVRSALEDPEPDVRAAAHQSLQSLLGSQADLAINAYRSGPPEEESWLFVSTEVLDHDEDSGQDEIAASDLDGLIQVARYESDPALRVRAIRWLSRSSDMRATETLAYLAQYGDSLPLRTSARQALEDRYGPQSEEIFASYHDSEMDEEDVEDELEGDLEEDDFDEEIIAEEDEMSENETGDDDSENSEVISPYPRTVTFQPGRFHQDEKRLKPVVEEVSISWRTAALILFLVLVIVIILILVR